MNFNRLSCASALCAATILAPSVQAANLASDSQADAAYATWDPGDNGGTGWGGGWTFRNQTNLVLTAGNSSRGWFVASALGNNSPANSDGNGDGDVNSPSTAKAWGLYSNSGEQVYAIRPFGGGPLSVGQTVAWDMDNGNIAAGQVVGLRFLSNVNDVNSRVFEARFVGGDSAYSLVGAPNQNTTIPFTREGLHLEYTLTGASTYSITITRLQDGTMQTYTGNNVNANAIMGLAFKNQFAGSGAAANAYLNNIAIIPEPASAVLSALGGILFMAARRLRK